MSSLFELNGVWQELANMLYQDDVDEQMILDTLESIEGEIEDKADSYAYIIADLQNNNNLRTFKYDLVLDYMEKNNISQHLK